MKPFELYGIFGHPLSHTLSPLMQEEAFRRVKRKAFYLVFDLPEKPFRASMRELRRFRLCGFNLTVPYKEKVLRYLDRLDPEARLVGAVNTVYRKGGLWRGANTDVDGFCLSLEKQGRFRTEGKRCLVLGAGGAARAVVYALLREKAGRVTIVNRSGARARKIIRDYAAIDKRKRLGALPAGSDAASAEMDGADLVVNATSLGLSPKDALPLPEKWIRRASKQRKLFYDLVYRPAETGFLKAARRKGHRVLGGAGMLLYQGARAFELWTGREAPVKAMQRVLLQALKDV